SRVRAGRLRILRGRVGRLRPAEAGRWPNGRRAVVGCSLSRRPAGSAAACLRRASLAAPLLSLTPPGSSRIRCSRCVEHGILRLPASRAGSDQRAMRMPSCTVEARMRCCSSVLAAFATLAIAAVAGAQQPGQQEAVITGTVATAAGAPLPYASVFLKDLRVGVVTGTDGTYRLVIPAARVSGKTDSLTVRLIGYQEKAVAMAITPGAHAENFVLEANPLRLGEVVVTGEGTSTTREKLGNVINTVDTSLISRSNESNVVSALAGKAPNVEVNSSSGDPGSSSYIRIRGPKTITGTGQPLFVVDGVPIDNSTYSTEMNPLAGTTAPNRASDINPADIASVEILKGAAAAAIYGARAGQ